jgi:hypothetical protein
MQQHPHRYTVPPRTFTRLAVQTDPHALCTVHQEGCDIERPLKAFADPEGIVRFDLRPSGESPVVHRFILDAEVDGNVTQYPLELRFSFEPTDAMPVPKGGHSLPRQGLRPRPPLSQDDMLGLSHIELLQRGYPLRPSPETAPEIFRSWRRLVSIPGYVLEPHTIARPDTFHVPRLPAESTATSNNWCGFELPSFLKISGLGLPAGFMHYDYVRGMWTVPSASPSLNRSTCSSMWVGIDGDGTADLVQAGTETDTANYFNGFISATLLTFYAWTEFLPQQSTAVQITNFPVSAGDQMFVEVWIGNQESGPSLNGKFGVFFMMNLNTGISTYIYTPVGNTLVHGKEAVWIVERPTESAPASGIFGPYKYLPLLSDFGSAMMTDAYAGRSDIPGGAGYLPYFGLATKQITMTNDADDITLATATSLNSDSMRFDWEAFGTEDVVVPAS